MGRTVAIFVSAALLAVVSLGLIRGGYRDSVLLPVGAAGVGILIAAVVRRLVARFADDTTGRRGPIRLLRNALALLVGVALLFWAGPFIGAQGFGAPIAFVGLCLSASLLAALLGTGLPVLFGAYTATCIAISLWVSNLSTPSPYRTDFLEDWQGHLFTLAVAVASASLTSLPVHLARRRTAMRSS